MSKKIKVKGQIISNDMKWIYDWFEMESTCPKDIETGLNEAQGEDVVLEINSPGGVVVYGYEMYNAIRTYEGKVTAHVVTACSAATLLACAADETLISEAGLYMIHNAQTSTDGDYRDMQMSADALREFNAGIINVYERKTGKSREELQALMDKDTYMSPQTAIEAGFADGYIAYDAPMTAAVAAASGIIPESKAMELMQIMAKAGAYKVPDNDGENGKAVPDITKTKGETKMTLKELLGANPEAQAELDQMINEIRAEAEGTDGIPQAEVDRMVNEAREAGAAEERARIQSLDAISATVTPEALNEAKYGENPTDGKTLAYEAMTNGQKLAQAYMTNAVSDSAASGAQDVGVGSLEEETQGDTAQASDSLAGYVNNLKGGK